VVVKDIIVLEVETPLVIKQPSAWHFYDKLVFNTVKCAVLFHSNQRKCVDKPNIMYKNIVLVYSPDIKFLSITLYGMPYWSVRA